MPVAKLPKLIGAVQRAINILDLFDHQHPELGITEIADTLLLPKGTTAGLVATLEYNGYLDQNPETRKYRLGFKLAERAGVLLSQFDLRQVARPYLEELRDACNESINLAVRDGWEVVYIERVFGTNMLGMRSEIGKREQVHSTALGKALLAFLPEAEINSLLTDQPLRAVTSRTITSPVAFLYELSNVRRCGFAVDNQENELGGRCVAAPIFDFVGKPLAAVSISVPIQRFPDEQIPILGELVGQFAAEISRKLGASRLWSD